MGGSRPKKKEQIMKRYLAVLPALVMAGAFAATPSTAMPVAKSTAQSSATVEKVGYRKCYWRHGHKHCRWIDDGPSVSIEFGRRHRHHHGYHYGHRRGHGHYGHNDSGVRLRVR
jgi:hypothetical protein